MLLKKNFEPTDFADADCRVTEWYDWTYFDGEIGAYRIWICKCGNGHWFQRHEWRYDRRNQTDIDGWIYSGYFPRREWRGHFDPAPDMREI